MLALLNLAVGVSTQLQKCLRITVVTILKTMPKMQLGYMLCQGIDMLHKGTSLQDQDFVRSCTNAAGLFGCAAAVQPSWHLAQHTELLLPFTDPQPWGLTDTSQYKWSLCAIMTALPLDLTAVTVWQWGFSANVSVCSVSSLRRQCMVCYVSTIISTNGTGPFAPVQ